MTPTYIFNEADSIRAAEQWGANCGPNALAFALQIPLDSVRGRIPDFEERRYTSPTMMRSALIGLNASFIDIRSRDKDKMFCPLLSLVRIQWRGPWTEPGANPKWAYRQTHWVCCWSVGEIRYVFDCNGGAMLFPRWKDEIVPILIPPRGNGEWFPTHIWRIPSSAASGKGE